MGCDVHGFWELKTPEGVWVAFELINDSRSYWWFGIIANVRRTTPECQTADRGVPEDCSAAWRQYTDSAGSDLHSHTWLTPDEVIRANRRLFLEYRQEDERATTTEEISDAHSYHEVVPTVKTEVSRIFLPGPDGYYTEMTWTGTLEENIGTQDIAGRLRMVVAFDN